MLFGAEIAVGYSANISQWIIAATRVRFPISVSLRLGFPLLRLPSPITGTITTPDVHGTRSAVAGSHINRGLVRAGMLRLQVLAMPDGGARAVTKRRKA